MAKNQKKNDSAEAPAEAPDPNARRVTTDEDKARARPWFAKAKKLVDDRNYDYAIKCYLDALAVWPEAVEEGHQLLRACSAARMATGGKKPGLTDGVKHSMTHKDPLTAMLNAEWLLAHDPTNVTYMEGLFKNANKARCDDTAMWIGPILRNAAEQEKKPGPKRFALLKETYEELGDRAQARGEVDLAVEAYTRALEAITIQARIDPKDSSLPNIRRDLSTKLTILKGKYQTAESFTESVRDREGQAEIHDRDRMVQTSSRLAELIASAERDLAEHPGVPAKVLAVAELLCREEHEPNELRAIGLLVEHYKSSGEYRYKQQADDIRMRQLLRQFRQVRESGDRDAIRETRTEQLRFELKVYAERMQQYPTDQRMRFEYARRLFEGGRFDDAIPLLQIARADARNRSRCDLYLGRCFFEKGYHRQAADTLSRALAASETTDDQHAKALRYWLGRAQEAGGQAVEALQSYGQLLLMDYNYRDVRARMDALSPRQGQVDAP